MLITVRNTAKYVTAVYLLFNIALADAAIPQTLNYQGVLTNPSTGQPVTTPNGSPLSMTFNIYDVSTSGTPLYTETQTVTVTNGIFNVQIGSASGFSSLAFDVPYYLEIVVGTTNAQTLTPRQPLASSATALRSVVAESLTATPVTCTAGQYATGIDVHGNATGCSAPSSNVVPGTGQSNTAFGNGTLSNNTTGYFNTANGYQALFSNTTGYSNTANSIGALWSNTTGNYNTANGQNALYSNTTGSNNIGIGYGAGTNLTSGDYNIYIGNPGVASESGTIRIGTGGIHTNTIIAGNLTASGTINGTVPGTGQGNTSYGYGTLSNNTTGSNNTANGPFALQANTTGNWNTAVGFSALFSNNGTANAAFGTNALAYNTTGNNNVSVGDGNMQLNQTGSTNTAVGQFALKNNIAGSGNIALGQSAGVSLTGDNNIDIGNNGVAGESGIIRIGTTGTQTATFIAGNTTIAGNLTASGTINGLTTTVPGTGTFNTTYGIGTLSNNTTGSNNTASGLNALKSNTTGNWNTATGFGALSSNNGTANAAFGSNALAGNTTGNGNVAVGDGNMQLNQSGSTNTAVGQFALKNNIAGSGNIALGQSAGVSLTGDNNIDIGNNGVAGESGIIRIGTTGTQSATFIAGNTTIAGNLTTNGTINGLTTTVPGTGTFNTTYGIGTLSNNTTGSNNTASGLNALKSNTTGNWNTATGFGALSSNNGTANAAFGTNALAGNTTGNGNVAVGDGNMQLNQTGSTNTAVGQFALKNNIAGSGNIALGQSAGVSLTGDNNIDIGNIGVAGESGIIRIGTSGTHSATYIAGALYNPSDRNLKENFTSVDEQELLNKVAGLPLLRWSYKNDEQHVLHVGPMAQDFYASFKVGADDRHIATIDEGGVALAAIKGLNQKLESVMKAQAEKIAALEKQHSEQTAQIAELKRTVEFLVARAATDGKLALAH